MRHPVFRFIITACIVGTILSTIACIQTCDFTHTEAGTGVGCSVGRGIQNVSWLLLLVECCLGLSIEGSRYWKEPGEGGHTNLWNVFNAALLTISQIAPYMYRIFF